MGSYKFFNLMYKAAVKRYANCKRDFTLSFIKCWDTFDVSKAVYVNAFDPILVIGTIGYFHHTFIRHCLCFEVFSVASQYKSRLTMKFFSVRYMNIEVLKRNEIQ